MSRTIQFKHGERGEYITHVFFECNKVSFIKIMSNDLENVQYFVF